MHKEAEKSLVKKAQTRGAIYDRNGVKLVTNTPVFSVVYRYDARKSSEQMYKTAEILATILDVRIDKLSTSNLKTIYQRQNPKLDWADIQEAQIAQLSVNDKRAFVLFNKMTEAYYGGENTLKFAITDQEVARVVEHIDQLDGVEVVTQSQREYPKDAGYHDIVGRVSKGDANFPAEDFSRYMAAGYSVNDQVGLSSIERQYEDYLRGSKVLQEISHTGETTEIFSGISGSDLTLTIDTKFSDSVDLIVERHMKKARSNRPAARYLNEAYVVVVDPNNGEVLSLNGKIIDDDGKFIDNPLGTMHNSFTMGSVVKGATLLAGYHHGVTRYGDTIIDEPMIFADKSEKASWSKLGRVNDITALKSSSNVYFMQQAIRMGGDHYFPRKNLRLNPDTVNIYRDFFSTMGLGTQTGIDLPSEQTGLKNPDQSVAKLLDFVIGQSDTYTTLQLAGYVATIANGGNRYALQLLKEAAVTIDTDEKILLYSAEPNLLNRVDLPAEALNRVQEGFRQVLQTHGGTGYSHFRNSRYAPAGKTGTAEEFARDGNGHFIYTANGNLIGVNHMTFVGFAPFDNPEIALAVVFPQAELPSGKNPIALEVAKDVIDAYFDSKEK